MNEPNAESSRSAQIHADAQSGQPKVDRPGCAFHAAVAARHSGEQTLDNDGNPWSNID